MIHRTDDELLIAFVQGDENALRELVERWQRPVFAFLVRMLDSREEAEDLCQETFLRIAKAAAGYQDQGRFESWLFRIAGNLARTRLRRRRIVRWIPLARRHESTPSSERDPLERLESEEQDQRVREAIARLPERQREALVLKHFHDFRYDQIAEVLGVSVGSVQMLLHRARASLRKELLRESDAS